MREADQLIIEAESKLKSAKILFENRCFNDAISRAYYSMHYSARALLSLKSIIPKTHKGVIRQFGLEFVKQGLIEEYHAKALSVAQESRERADYGIEHRFTQDETASIIQSAEAFLERVRQVMREIDDRCLE